MVLPIQSALTSPYPSKTEEAIVPRLGIILDVTYSDDPRSRSAQQYQSFRGVAAEATVYLTEVGNIIYNVVITPDIASGMNDYYEKFPRKAQHTVDGKQFSVNGMTGLDVSDLDGDWCVVDFLNGRITQPYVQRWWPNPRNFYDPATSGKGNPVLGTGQGAALKQNGRAFTRVNGVETVITPEGDVWFSTKLANSKLTPDNQMGATDRVARKKSAKDGGSVLVSIKPSQDIDITFDDHPDGVGPGMVHNDSLPQRNPNPLGALPVTQSNTHIHADKSSFSVKVPVNFEVESKGSIVEKATTSIETDAPLIQHGANAQQYVSLADDTLTAINRLENIFLAINTEISAIATSPSPTLADGKAVAAAIVKAITTARLAVLGVGNPTRSVAATKVKAE